MAERLKEFVNGTLTSADLTGVNNDEFIIIDNDATTQAVVKDVTVESIPTALEDVDATVTMMSNDITIGDAVTSTGTEIIDTDNTFKFKLDPAPSGSIYVWSDISILFITSRDTVSNLNENYYVSKQPSGYPLGNITDLEILQKYEDPLITEITSTSPNITTPSMTSPVWYYQTDTYAYYFNYNGNNNTDLYRATVTSGVPQSWSTVNTNSYSYKALDVENKKVYWVIDTTVYVHDMETNNTTNLGSISGATGASSYSTSGTANGVFIYLASSSDKSRFWFLDTNRSISGYITLTDGVNTGSGTKLAVVYNPSEDVYYIYAGANTSVKLYKVAGDFVSGDTATYIGGNILPNGVSSDSYYWYGDSSGKMYLVNTDDSPEVVSISSDTVSSVIVFTGISLYGNSSFIYSGTTNTQYDIAPEDFALELKTKVSGVEITEVN